MERAEKRQKESWTDALGRGRRGVRTWLYLNAEDSTGAKDNPNMGSEAAFAARPGTGWFDAQRMVRWAR